MDNFEKSKKALAKFEEAFDNGASSAEVEKLRCKVVESCCLLMTFDNKNNNPRSDEKKSALESAAKHFN